MGSACDKCLKAAEGSSTKGVDSGGEDDGEGSSGDTVAVAGTAFAAAVGVAVASFGIEMRGQQRVSEVGDGGSWAVRANGVH